MLICANCKLYFHIECVGYEKRYFLLDNNRKSQWKCSPCQKSTITNEKCTPIRSGAGSRPPPKQVEVKEKTLPMADSGDSPPMAFKSPVSEVIDPFQNVTVRGHSQKLRGDNRSLDENSPPGDTALEITTALKEYIAEQMSNFTQQLLTKIDTLATSIQTFNSRFNHIEERITTIEKRLDEKVNDNIHELAVTVDRLKCELNDREQEILLNDIEISGIPEANGENPVHIATLIGNKLGVTIDERDVVGAERVGARRSFAAVAGGAGGNVDGADETGGRAGPRPLVVRLLRRSQRDELLRAARVRRAVDTAGLNLPSPPRRFYVNERLTRANRLLFRRVREMKQQLEWKFAWTRDGTVLVRRDVGESVKRIRSEADFLKVFGSKAVSAE